MTARGARLAARKTVRDISLPPLTKSSRSGLIEIVSKSARNFKCTTQDKRLLTSESRNRLKTDLHSARRKTGHTGHATRPQTVRVPDGGKIVGGIR